MCLSLLQLLHLFSYYVHNIIITIRRTPINQTPATSVFLSRLLDTFHIHRDVLRTHIFFDPQFVFLFVSKFFLESGSVLSFPMHILLLLLCLIFHPKLLGL